MNAHHKSLLRRRVAVDKQPNRAPSQSKKFPLGILILLLSSLATFTGFWLLSSTLKTAGQALQQPAGQEDLSWLQHWLFAFTPSSELASQITSSNQQRQTLRDLAATRLETLHQQNLDAGRLLQHNPQLAAQHFIYAEQAARDLGLADSPAKQLREELPTPIQPPADLRLTILRQEQRPATQVEFLLEGPAEQLPPRLTAADIQLQSDQGALPHLVLEARRTAVGSAAIAICLDCSSSMQGERFSEAVTALTSFTQEGSPSTRLQLISFASTAEFRTPLTTDRRLVVTALQQSKAEGTTALSAAVLLALRSLEQSDAALKAIVLCTDGQDPGFAGNLPTIIARCQAGGIAVHVLAIDDPDLDQSNLQQLTNRTGGILTLARSPQSIAAELDKILTRLTRTTYLVTALNPQLQRPLTLTVAGLKAELSSVKQPK
jgi:uncharacterized protein YegL